jgi:hypothetical protein
MNDIACPFCGHEQNINHDDGYGFEEDKIHNQECGNCGKIFGYTTSISYYYESLKTECLNTEEDTHDWKLTMTFPREFSKMRCSYCSEERDITDIEKEKYKYWLLGKSNIYPGE